VERALMRAVDVRLIVLLFGECKGGIELDPEDSVGFRRAVDRGYGGIRAMDRHVFMLEAASGEGAIGKGEGVFLTA
jgi:hypothetical protein